MTVVLEFGNGLSTIGKLLSTLIRQSQAPQADQE